MLFRSDKGVTSQEDVEETSDQENMSPEWEKRLFLAMAVARKTRCVVFSKGAVDIITDGELTAIVGREGSAKRPGGLGDVTAGLCGVFMDWCQDEQKRQQFSEKIAQSLSLSAFPPEEKFPMMNSGFLAALISSTLCRVSGQTAYNEHLQETTAEHVLTDIGKLVSDLYRKYPDE